MGRAGGKAGVVPRLECPHGQGQLREGGASTGEAKTVLAGAKEAWRACAGRGASGGLLHHVTCLCALCAPALPGNGSHSDLHCPPWAAVLSSQGPWLAGPVVSLVAFPAHVIVVWSGQATLGLGRSWSRRADKVTVAPLGHHWSQL